MLESVFNFPSVPVTANISRHAPALDDRERLEKLAYHVETGDYFRFLSTLLGFVEETLAGADSGQELVSLQLAAVKAAREDLRYLQDHYRIEPRP